MTKCLCSDCERLGISPERFLYGPDKGSTASEQGQSQSTPTATFCHKLTRKIKRNGSCTLCRLIHKSIADIDNEQVKDETECTVEWVKDGQQIPSTNRYDTASRRRRIRISWSPTTKVDGSKTQDMKSLYLLYIPSQSPTHPNKITNLMSDEEIDFLREDYNLDIFAWIRSWIKLCEKKHQIAYTQIEEKDTKALHDLARETWFCVVDVERMCLSRLEFTKNGHPEPYAALSYVWGTDQESSHRTFLSNIMDRSQDNGLVLKKELPRTLQDAIELVKKLSLGIRYIWIDALCIAQDSFISWKHNAEKTDLIFGNAHFTICAADGDSHAGLLAMHAKTRDRPKKEEVKKDLELFVSRSPESVIESSVWSKRGWTFQERILSRRCLVFAEGRIYLQCRENNYDYSSTNWSSDWRKSPLSIVKGLEDRPMWFYMTCVELYTGRTLTRLGDILEAFNGVTRIIEERMCARFFFGLPSSHFDFALLWRPRSGKKPRPGNPREDQEFPSWSWSGWQECDSQKGHGSAVYYPSDVLEGCLLDLHDWLLYHTWIVWYIRDSNGDLEPLWQGYTENYTERSQKVVERWKGYESKWDVNMKENRNDVYAYDRRRQHFDPPSPPTDFKVTLPHNPFGVRVSRERKNSYQSILQFWTWKREFFIVLNNDLPGPGNGLARLDVLDHERDWYGTVVVDESFAEKQDGKVHEFIALSDARNFTGYECPRWVHPIPKNLEDIDWDLYHVMLIEYCKERCVWERRGLGKVLKAAFEPLDEERWAEITLG
ncbi:HET-domain-containing protein [Acephala macrosclerotiorum]|nr:HET-domain-containing protein [Acephala macrosclerotiorum]